MADYNIISIDRAFCVLAAILESEAALGLASLSKHTGVNKTTLLRICTTLERQGMLVRNQQSQYSLGPLAGLLGMRYVTENRVDSVVQPMLSALAARAGESVSFQVRAASRARACLFRADPGRGRLVADVIPGKAIPLVERGATARTLMAYLDEPSEQREAIRDRGYCISVGECHAGCAAVSVPVFRSPNELHGVISVFGTSQRFTDRYCSQLLPGLIETASHLGKALSSREH